MNLEEHRKGVESARNLLNKRLYEAFIDLAEEIAELMILRWWFVDDSEVHCLPAFVVSSFLCVFH